MAERQLLILSVSHDEIGFRRIVKNALPSCDYLLQPPSSVDAMKRQTVRTVRESTM